MKNSNKLLLAGFLLVVLLIAAIHISLYAKYKAGNYTLYNPDAYLPAGALQTFPGVLVVALHHVPAATIQFSQQTQIQKEEGQEFNVVQKGDTLLITAKDSVDRGGFESDLNLRLPYNATLVAYRSNVVFAASRRNTPVNSTLYLQRSTARFTGNGVFLDRLRITAANQSSVSFPDSTGIGQLDLELSNSAVHYGRGNIGQLSISTDSSSSISISTKQLLKATVKATQ